MAFDVVDQNGVIEVVPAEKGKYETVEAASTASQKLVAAAVKAEVAEQDAMDAEAEAASVVELPEPEKTIEAIRASDDLDALAKDIPKSKVVDAAKSLDLKSTGTKVEVMQVVKDAQE